MAVPSAAKWGLAVQLAASFAFVLTQLGNRVGAILFSRAVDALQPPARGQRAYTAVLRLLQDTEPPPAGGTSRLAACAPKLKPGTHLVVISDFLTPGAMRSELTTLRRIGEDIHAIQVLDPLEVTVPCEDECELFDIETGELISLPGGESPRQQARRRLEEHVAGLRQHCANQQIPFTSCLSAQGWHEILLAHLLRLGPLHA